MKILTIPLFAIIISLSAMVNAAQPDSLAHLKELQNDEVALVAAARRFHHQQTELNQWDGTMFQQYSGADKVKMREEMIQKARNRNNSIKLAWEYVLSVYPKNIKALNFMGEYWYDIGGNQASAVMNWNTALAINDKFSLPHNNLGLHYFHSGDYRKGFLHLRQALELEPKNPDFLYNMAQMYLVHFPFLMENYKLNKKTIYAQAMKYSKEATKQDPTDVTLQQDYATNFYSAENFDVEADWEKAAKAWQDTYVLATRKNVLFFARLNEGRCWIRANKKTEALVALEAAQVLDPTSDVTKTLLAKVRATPQDSPPKKESTNRGR